MNPGRLEVICGPMFAGKSEELIRRVHRASFAKLSSYCFKYSGDTRYHSSSIASHDKKYLTACAVKGSEDLLNITGRGLLDEIDVLALDEVQFFDDEIVNWANAMVKKRKRVILAGLDLDYLGVPFGPMPALMAMADSVTKLSAVCTQCGKDAMHTYRLTTNPQLVLVGSQEIYDARCRDCFNVEI